MLTSPAFCRQGRELRLNNSVSRLDILTICLSKIFKCAINVTGDRRWHCLINTMTEVTHSRLWLGFAERHALHICACRGSEQRWNTETPWLFLLPLCLFRGKPVIPEYAESGAITDANVFEWQQLLGMCNPGAPINAKESRFLRLKCQTCSDETSMAATRECHGFAGTEGGSKTSCNKLFLNCFLYGRNLIRGTQPVGPCVYQNHSTYTPEWLEKNVLQIFRFDCAGIQGTPDFAAFYFIFWKYAPA